MVPVDRIEVKAVADAPDALASLGWKHREHLQPRGFGGFLEVQRGLGS